MPIAGIIIIFLYVLIVIFTTMAGFSVNKEKVHAVFMVASWISVVALGICAIFGLSNITVYSIMAIVLALFIEKVFYSLAAEVIILRQYGVAEEGESKSIICLTAIAFALIIGVCFVIIRIMNIEELIALLQ